MKFLRLFACFAVPFIWVALVLLGYAIDVLEKEVADIKMELVAQHALNQAQWEAFEALSKAHLRESQLNALPHHEPIHNY